MIIGTLRPRNGISIGWTAPIITIQPNTITLIIILTSIFHILFLYTIHMIITTMAALIMLALITEDDIDSRTNVMVRFMGASEKCCSPQLSMFRKEIFSLSGGLTFSKNKKPRQESTCQRGFFASYVRLLLQILTSLV